MAPCFSEPDGNLMEESNDDLTEFRAVDSQGAHDPDELNKIKNVIAAAKEDTEVFPDLTSYNPQNQSFDPAIGAMLTDPAKARCAAAADYSASSPECRRTAGFRWISRICQTMRSSRLSAVHPGSLCGYACAQSAPVCERRGVGRMTTISSDRGQLRRRDVHELRRA